MAGTGRSERNKKAALERRGGLGYTQTMEQEREMLADARRGKAWLRKDHVQTAATIVEWCGMKSDGTAVLIDNKRVLVQNIADALAAAEFAALKDAADKARKECERLSKPFQPLATSEDYQAYQAYQAEVAADKERWLDKQWSDEEIAALQARKAKHQDPMEDHQDHQAEAPASSSDQA